MELKRRSFIAGGAMLAAAGTIGRVSGKEVKCEGGVCTLVDTPPKKLNASAPMLQNAAERTIDVVWAVSALANGFVEYSENPDLTGAKKVKCGGFRVTDMNDKVMRVRVKGLKPATRYYYRIGADRIEYKGGYAMKILGTEIDPVIRSFTTLGAQGKSSFCVINDTHVQMKPFGMQLAKVAEVKPACVVWNGDACNTQETLDSLIPIFLTPAVAQKDYAAEMPYLVVPGNHDDRGRAARELEKVVMFRPAEERLSRDWDLGRNFAVRCGEIAMIGLDTGEDKLDGRDVFAGLFNMEPYRVAQTAWLEEALTRPEIRSAPYLVAFCHIPLFDSNPRSNPGDCDKDGDGKYSADFAYWQKTCADMWGPLLAKAGCQVVITAHQHKYRYDAPAGSRTWGHVVGGGPELGISTQYLKDGTRKSRPDDSRFPTVIEGAVEGGKLVIRVHDVLKGKLAGTFTYDRRSC